MAEIKDRTKEKKPPKSSDPSSDWFDEGDPKVTGVEIIGAPVSPVEPEEDAEEEEAR